MITFGTNSTLFTFATKSLIIFSTLISFGTNYYIYDLFLSIQIVAGSETTDSNRISWGTSIERFSFVCLLSLPVLFILVY